MDVASALTGSLSTVLGVDFRRAGVEARRPGGTLFQSSSQEAMGAQTRELKKKVSRI